MRQVHLTKDHRESKRETLITPRSWRRYRVGLAGPRGEVEAACRLWAPSRVWDTCLYYSPRVRCFGAPWLRTDRSIQTRKCWVLVSFAGVFSKGGTKEAPGDRENAYLKGPRDSQSRRSHLLVTLGCYLGHALGLGGAARVRSPPLQAPRPHRMEAKRPWYGAVSLNCQHWIHPLTLQYSHSFRATAPCSQRELI